MPSKMTAAAAMRRLREVATPERAMGAARFFKTGPEARVLALLILAEPYKRARINNWDLVDCSAPHIVGAHVRDGDRSILRKLARSKSLWRIAAMLVRDEHDLIHKAAGWMLREAADVDRARVERFLREHIALRYAIEKFPPELRRAYLSSRA